MKGPVRGVSLVLSSLLISLLSVGCEKIYGIGDLPLPAGEAGPPGPGPGACPIPQDTCPQVNVAALPRSGGPACAPAVGCSPKDVSTFVPSWIPPVPRLGQCSTAQLDTFFAACIDASADVNACNAWGENAANKTCLGCLLTDNRAAAYGAGIVIQGVGTLINIPGCVALAEPCNRPCAEAMLASILCAYMSCDPTPGGNCAVSDDATLRTQQSCLLQATMAATPSCAFRAYAPAEACKQQLTGPSIAKCGGPFRSLATFMCGPC